MFFAHPDTSIHKPLPHLFPCHLFSSHVPSKSLTIQPNQCLQHINWKIMTYLADPLANQVNNQVRGSGFYPLLSLMGVPEKGCNAAAVHCWVVPAYSGEIIHKTGLNLLFFLSTDPKEFPMKYRMGEKRQCSRSGDHRNLGHFM